MNFCIWRRCERDCVCELHCWAPDGSPALSLVVSEVYFNSKFNEWRRTNKSKLMEHVFESKHASDWSPTGQLSSRGLFLARAAVRRHISATESCREAGLGFPEVHVEARAGEVMAVVGGAAGPAPDVRHQPPGDTECCERKTNTYTV
jgi:hypothetical protein